MPPLKQDKPSMPVLHVPSIYRGTLVSLGLSLGFSVLVGLTYYFTNLAENTMSWVATGILFISVASGSAYAAKKARNKGLFNGLGVGFTTFIIIWLLAGLFLPGHILLVGALGKLSLTLLAGAIGGMVGISLAS